jgi:aminobenzoyl-glutamate utilization protein B
MSTRTWWLTGLAGLVVLAMAVPQAQRPATPAADQLTPLTTPVAKADARVMKLKEVVSADVLGMYDLGQQMVDSVFSFGELGFQEFETQRYITGILKEHGFTIETASRASRRPGWRAMGRAGR